MVPNSKILINKTRKINWPLLLEKGARFYVFLMINAYAWGKLMGGQFYRKGKLPAEVAKQTMAEVNSFDLAWTFMGYSYTYILFIGVSQLIGSWMLLWNKTKLLGALILLPILINIVVFDFVFLDRLGALASAALYLFLTIIILFINRKKLWASVFQLLVESPEGENTRSGKWVQVGAVLLLLVMLFSLDQLLVNLFAH